MASSHGSGCKKSPKCQNPLAAAVSPIPSSSTQPQSTMAATAVAARSRALARAVSSSFLLRGCHPASRRASCVNRYSPSTLAPDASSFHISSRAHTSCTYRCFYALVGCCRLPLVSSGLLSALPLHSAIASARLRSAIASESRSWCLVPQGNSMPL
ncbi:unnamed protein product [Urochloa decumbens]|uniref:Uncharacterized protein n=1 Tax=Urochloa decumbens TaxID=240449 RepID=A0ABC9CM91_9POAL